MLERQRHRREQQQAGEQFDGDAQALPIRLHVRRVHAARLRARQRRAGLRRLGFLIDPTGRFASCRLAANAHSG
ncbi:hypothetical protein WQQ_15910 [Hydrocarboniphaga effusa AP103]|uniref:Uncharacterized protein n=1 Tax=Hydrocarboniphaga effusa AP103 TaxID=1172194 RepID=I7ZHT5_9GAMM|nr:hypothetical protein WQQ_15910 [Hydrocarboniphaga effusa AP103]